MSAPITYETQQLLKSALGTPEAANEIIVGITGNATPDNSTIIVNGSNQFAINNNVNLPGSTASAGFNQQNLIVQQLPSTNFLLGVTRGWVNSNGSIAQGEGFRVSHTFTGVYSITFSNGGYNAVPVIVATVINSIANPGMIVVEPDVVNPTILTFGSNGSAQNFAFTFIAIG